MHISTSDLLICCVLIHANADGMDFISEQLYNRNDFRRRPGLMKPVYDPVCYRAFCLFNGTI